MRKSFKIVNEVCDPRSTSQVQFDCQVGSNSLTLIHIRSASDFPVQSKLLVKICVVLQTLQATSCPVKVMTSRFDSDSLRSHTSCDDSVSSSLLRIAHANSSVLSFLMSPAFEPLTTVYDDCPERIPHSSRPSLQQSTSDPIRSRHSPRR